MEKGKKKGGGWIKLDPSYLRKKKRRRGKRSKEARGRETESPRKTKPRKERGREGDTEIVRLRRRSRWKEVKTEGMPTPPLAPMETVRQCGATIMDLYMERRPRGWSPTGRLTRRHPGFIGTIGALRTTDR